MFEKSSISNVPYISIDPRMHEERCEAQEEVFTLVMGWLHVDASRSRMWMWLFQPRLGLFH